jgi:general secretion pathway protein G
MNPKYSASQCRRTGAFTLLEILVALGILAMLATLAVTQVDKVFGQSQQSVAQLFVRDSMHVPLLRYRMDMGAYPTTAQGLDALLHAPGGGAAGQWKGPYFEVRGGTRPLDPWGQPYEYRQPGVKNPSGYDLYSAGPDRKAGTDDDIGNW